MAIKRGPVHVLRDVCPRCSRVALPGALHADGKGGLVAHYYCFECGNSWTCNFLKEAVPGLDDLVNGPCGSEKLIEIELPKGCRLFLTPAEYSRGLIRGKGIRRTRQFREREKQWKMKAEV